MKSTSIRGTPVHHIGTGGTRMEGVTPGKPKGMSGTVNQQFEGTQVTNRENGATGTPYNSRVGNSDEAIRVRSHGKYGINDANGQGEMNNPVSNGNGVIFDGIQDFMPPSEPALDSPVPSGAQAPIPEAAKDLAALRSGEGSYWGRGAGPLDNFQEMGGVMSRGMIGTSTPAGGENEMLEDDVLMNLGSGGAVGGSQKRE